MKYYAIGDIHGELDMLTKLLDKLDYEHEDKIVFLGDYIDRGPDPKGVIDFLINFKKIHPRCIFLRGNHEAMFMDYLNGRNVDLFLYNGGDTTVASYGAESTFDKIEIPKNHMKFLQDTHRVYETENMIFVHAGVAQIYEDVHKLPDDILLWARETSYLYVTPKKRVVFGHTPFENAYQKDLMLGLDTGAVFGGKLTCGVLGENGKLQKLVTVKAERLPPQDKAQDKEPTKFDDKDLDLLINCMF